MEWIDCKDQFPPCYTLVLIWHIKQGCTIGYRFYVECEDGNDYGWEYITTCIPSHDSLTTWGSESFSAEDEEITWWAYLPKLYMPPQRIPKSPS